MGSYKFWRCRGRGDIVIGIIGVGRGGGERREEMWDIEGQGALGEEDSNRWSDL